jgi:hypothetical protein
MNNFPSLMPLPEDSLAALCWNLLLGIFLSSFVGWHFRYRARSKMLRRDLGLVLPVICLTTLLVISVVKSSLALSLGLVGALSIVRFRTPIKEPEELAYIFLVIAIGLALGADQREIAVIATVFILLVIFILDRLRNQDQPIDGNVLLSIEVNKQSGSIEEILALLRDEQFSLDLRRVDHDDKSLSITALAKFNTTENLVGFCEEFEQQFPDGKFSIVDDFSFPND